MEETGPFAVHLHLPAWAGGWGWGVGGMIPTLQGPCVGTLEASADQCKGEVVAGSPGEGRRPWGVFSGVRDVGKSREVRRECLWAGNRSTCFPGACRAEGDGGREGWRGRRGRASVLRGQDAEGCPGSAWKRG